MNNKPCLDCPYRRLGCHAYCRTYKEFRVNLEAERSKRLKEEEYLRYLTGAEGAYNRMRVKRGVMRI